MNQGNIDKGSKCRLMHLTIHKQNRKRFGLHWPGTRPENPCRSFPGASASASTLGASVSAACGSRSGFREMQRARGASEQWGLK